VPLSQSGIGESSTPAAVIACRRGWHLVKPERVD